MTRYHDLTPLINSVLNTVLCAKERAFYGIDNTLYQIIVITVL